MYSHLTSGTIAQISIDTLMFLSMSDDDISSYNLLKNDVVCVISDVENDNPYGRYIKCLHPRGGIGFIRRTRLEKLESDYEESIPKVGSLWEIPHSIYSQEDFSPLITAGTQCIVLEVFDKTFSGRIPLKILSPSDGRICNTWVNVLVY